MYPFNTGLNGYRMNWIYKSLAVATDMDENRDEEGRYSQSFPESAFLEAVRELPVASTQLVSQEVGCSYDLAYRRLKELYRRREVEREEVGNSFVYYLSEE